MESGEVDFPALRDHLTPQIHAIIGNIVEIDPQFRQHLSESKLRLQWIWLGRLVMWLSSTVERVAVEVFIGEDEEMVAVEVADPSA